MISFYKCSHVPENNMFSMFRLWDSLPAFPFLSPFCPSLSLDMKFYDDICFSQWIKCIIPFCLLLLLLRIWLSSDHCFANNLCPSVSAYFFVLYVLSLQGNQGWGLPSCSWVKGLPPSRMGPPHLGAGFQADHHGHWWKAPGAQAAGLGEGITLVEL